MTPQSRLADGQIPEAHRPDHLLVRQRRQRWPLLRLAGSGLRDTAYGDLRGPVVLAFLLVCLRLIFLWLGKQLAGVASIDSGAHGTAHQSVVRFRMP
jgi:hypothetical protein